MNAPREQMPTVVIHDRIERLPISALVPYARNSRTHSDEQLAQIAASMREFGFTNPVLIDEQGGIVAGHGRVMAAQRLGMVHVPCLRLAGLTQAQRRAYVIADNQIALNAGWDDAMLRLELADLQAADFNLDLLGFDADRLDELLADDAGETEGLTDADAVPEVPEQPATRPGDVWLLGRHRVMCGDSTASEDVSRLMAGHKADLCFTSPPYNLGKSVALRNGARKGAASAYNDMDDCSAEWPLMMRSFIEIALSLCDFCAINVQLLAGNKLALLKMLGEYARRTADIAVWVKSNPQPAMAEGVMSSAFEFVWFLSSEDLPTRRLACASFDRGTFSNVFEHATASGHKASIHGAVFPVGVATHFIGGLSQTGASVYEPFCGSGTTLIAAEQLDRKCYGMELDPKYCDVIVRRWQDFTGQQATLEATGQTFDEVAAGA